jgi:mannosyl-3-phosphoglycerate phosphatase
MKTLVIFTDLDGTLLDHQTYSFAPAIPALRLARERGIPLVICSSKTRSEIERYREKLENRHPFITENGGGIFIPNGYFGPFLPLPDDMDVCRKGGYLEARLGASYVELRSAVIELRREGFPITGFGDMTPAEISLLSGLTEVEAALAKEREFDEPFLFEGDEQRERELEEAVRAKGFNLTQGRFFHILGESDKGKAVAVVADLYRRRYGEIFTVALGDSLNDLPMLERVDYPVLVKKPDGRHDPRIQAPRLIRAEGIGPVGWNRALLALLTKFSSP